MHVRLTRDFTFEAAHLLPKAPEGHKCRRLHGHSFRVEVTVEGEVDPATGWLLDYGEIKRLIEPLRAQLDHYYLNEVKGLENATSENLAIYIWNALRPTIPQLSAVTVWETADGKCTYRGA